MSSQPENTVPQHGKTAPQHKVLTADEAYDIMREVRDNPVWVGTAFLEVVPVPHLPFAFEGDPAAGAEYYACHTEGCDRIWCAVWTKDPVKKLPTVTDLDLYKSLATKVPCVDCSRKERREQALRMAARQEAMLDRRRKEQWEIELFEAVEPRKPIDRAQEEWSKILKGEAEEEGEMI